MRRLDDLRVETIIQTQRFKRQVLGGAVFRSIRCSPGSGVPQGPVASKRSVHTPSAVPQGPVTDLSDWIREHVTSAGRTPLVMCVAAAAAITSVPRSASADEWWGTDKVLHFTVSAGLGASAYALAVPITEGREYRVLAGMSASLLIGAAKEEYDALGHGDPSWRDFTWDIAGTAVGVIVAYSLDCLLSNPSKAEPNALMTRPLAISF